MRSLGVDVGQRHHDAVLLDGRAVTHSPVRFSDPVQLKELLEAWRPEVVAVDSPPRFAPTCAGRAAERALHMRGIRIFPCPCAERAEGNAFFDWMRTGFEVFAAAAAAGYTVSCATTAVRGRALEVYPHGSAVTLRGARPPAGTLRSAAGKRAWRTQVLADYGVHAGPGWTVDQVDAGLAAFTGVRSLEGVASAVGQPDEGVIMVPVEDLHDRYPAEDANPLTSVDTGVRARATSTRYSPAS
jgi:predicted nuclease with RNAse H fold